MPIRKYFLSSAVLFLLSFTFANGTVQFQLDNEVALPDSVSPGPIRFVDHDNDGYDDLIIDGDSTIASYSIKDGQVRDFFRKKVGSSLRKYAAGFIDNDSSLDFVEVFPQGIPMFSASEQKVMAITYLSSSGYAPSDPIILIRGMMATGMILICQHTVGIDELFLLDNDNDGKNELYGKAALLHEGDFGGSLDYTETIFPCFKYIFGQDSGTVIDSLPHVGAVRLPLYNDTTHVSLAFEVRREEKGYTAHIGCVIDRWRDFYIFNENSTLLERDFLDAHWCYNWNYSVGILDLLSWWAGDFISKSQRYEMLMNISDRSYDNSGCTTFVQELRCYSLASPDSLVEIWRDTIPDTTPFGFLFSDTRYQDRFLSFPGGRFLVFNSSDRQIVDSSQYLPAGSGNMIAYRTLDSSGEMLAIFQSGRNLKFYTIDITVGIADESGPQLPQSFVLHSPYPNPFNATLVIPVSIARKGDLTVDVFNVAGQKVARIFEGTVGAGENRFVWKADEFASGIYLVKASSAGMSAATRVVLMK